MKQAERRHFSAQERRLQAEEARGEVPQVPIDQPDNKDCRDNGPSSGENSRAQRIVERLHAEDDDGNSGMQDENGASWQADIEERMQLGMIDAYIKDWDTIALAREACNLTHESCRIATMFGADPVKYGLPDT